MALLKLGVGVDALSGKIGGQSVSITRNGTSIKNIGQPRRQATPKQSIQRFSTASITNKWQKLTSGQRSGWDATASNYTYTDKFGNVATRNGFQAFCFVNQNLDLINVARLETAPTYVAVNTPTINDISSGDKDFTIQGVGLQNDTTYVLYAQLHYSAGARSFTPIPVNIGEISRAQLLTGFNVVTLIPNEYSTLSRNYNLTIEIVTINNITGNRDLDPPRLTKENITQGLGLLINSYFPWTSDFLDFYGNVNPTDTGTVSLGTGFVNGGIDLTTAATSNILFPYNTFWDFNEPATNTPKSFCFWLQHDNGNGKRFLSNTQIGAPYRPVQYEVFQRFSNMAARMYQAYSLPRSEYTIPLTPPTSAWHFVGFSYTSPTTGVLVYDNVSDTVPFNAGTFNNPNPLQLGTVINGGYNSTNFKFNGAMSELTYFNQALDAAQFEVIRQANINGETIVDIN